MTRMLVRLFMTPRVAHDGHMTRLRAHDFPHARLLALVAVLVEVNHRGTLAGERARTLIRLSRHFQLFCDLSEGGKVAVSFVCGGEIVRVESTASSAFRAQTSTVKERQRDTKRAFLQNPGTSPFITASRGRKTRRT
jgi:hypothetical protein